MLQIYLEAEVETRLRVEASRRGLATERYLEILIVERLGLSKSFESLDDLFSRWEKEDSPSDAADISERERELQEFKDSMNRNRLESEGIGSRKPFP